MGKSEDEDEEECVGKEIWPPRYLGGYKYPTSNDKRKPETRHLVSHCRGRIACSIAHFRIFIRRNSTNFHSHIYG
jgi:hypothetical protein